MPRRLVPDLPGSLRDAMPAEYLANEMKYWRVRDQLLVQYAGKWVAFHNGQVIASGDDFTAVMDEAGRKGYPAAYIDKVGEEGTLRFRCRRTTFDYNTGYTPTALPQVMVTFYNFTQTHQQTFADVIPDTGSDLSALAESDSKEIIMISVETGL